MDKNSYNLGESLEDTIASTVGQNDTSVENNSSNDIKKEHTQFLQTYSCQDCCTTFSTVNASSPTHCLYCGGMNINKVEDKSFQDYHMIPFVYTLQNAISVYKKKIFHNPLIPFSFRRNSIMNHMKKIYVPCMLFNVTTSGNIVFIGADKINNIKGAPKQMFESLYTTNFDYSNVLIGQYSKIGDEILSNINNYNYASMSDLNLNFVSDSYFLSGDMDDQKVLEKTKEKIEKYSIGIVRGNVSHELKKVGNNNLTTSFTSSLPLFVPVYFLNFKHNGKFYFFFMNGQTGETIVDLPTSAVSVIVLGIILLLIVFFVVYLLAHFI